MASNLELFDIIIKFPINVLSQLSDDNLRKVSTELKMVYETKEQTISRLGKTLSFATTLESNIEAATQSLIKELDSFFRTDDLPKQDEIYTPKQRASSSSTFTPNILSPLSASRYHELSERQEYEGYVHIKTNHSIIITTNIEKYPPIWLFIEQYKFNVQIKSVTTWIQEAQNVNHLLWDNNEPNTELIQEFHSY